MQKSFHQFRLHFLFAVVSLVVGIAIGILFPLQAGLVLAPNQYESNSPYHFINPLLSCGDDNFSRIQNDQVLNLQNKINTFITSQKQQGILDDASVYFRELNGGQSLLINPDLQFVPASLLKVPLAMSVYRRSEVEPKLLGERVFFPAGDSAASEYFIAPSIAASSTYSVESLVGAMMINSDNNAALLLTHVISMADLDESYSDLGVAVPKNEKYTMTVPMYAGFFRVLYNATYLNHQNSEHLLGLLSQSAFKQGIVAGVPAGIVVAHKFGERGFNNPSPNQLHDCGIVYAKNPYLVCIMTQGTDYNVLASVISAISKMIYSYAGP